MSGGIALLRLDSLVTCTHGLGKVGLTARQSWVTIDDVPVLVDDDPEQRPVTGCPNLTVSTKPCTTTLRVLAGYSDLVTIDDRAVVRHDLDGLTDGTGGVFHYRCADPRQRWVVEVGP